MSIKNFIAVSLSALTVLACKSNTNENMSTLNLTNEWDKTFPKSELVNHSKVTFHNRYGIELAADMYVPRSFAGEIAFHIDLTHIIHRGSHRGLDARIERGRVNSHSAKAADANDSDALRINQLTIGQEVNSGKEILRIDVRGSHPAGLSAAFTGK